MNTTTNTTTREAYQKRTEAQLKEWSIRLTALENKAAKAGADLKKDLLAQVEEFKKIDVAGKEHLKTIESAATNTWDEVKADLTNKWNHLSGSADAIWARFNA